MLSTSQTDMYVQTNLVLNVNITSFAKEVIVTNHNWDFRHTSEEAIQKYLWSR